MKKTEIDLKSVVLIDVRTHQEFELRRIKDSLNIPMHKTFERIDEFKNFSKPIIVFCRSGMRSGWVAEILSERGINKIYNGGSIDEIEEKLKTRSKAAMLIPNTS